MYEMLKANYPSVQWDPWKLTKVPGGYWQDTSNHRNFLENLSKELNITKFEDWYNISNEVFKKI